MGTLESCLRTRRDQGGKLLAPYVTAGVRDDWLELLVAIADAGADTIEIGIPFSDPSMDGPIVQAASVQALARGVTPGSVLQELQTVQLDIPLTVMTYYNLVFRFGNAAFADELLKARVSGVILPDLPFEESLAWRQAAAAVGLETVLLVAPNTRDERLKLLCDESQGFVYAVSTLGVTGERESLAASASGIAGRVKAVTDKPVMIGFGISSPETAVEATESADGVIVGSAIMRQVLDGRSVSEVASFVKSLRNAL